MEHSQARVAQSGLCSPLCPTGQQQQEDEASECKDTPRRGDRASTGLTHRSATHIAAQGCIKAGRTGPFVGEEKGLQNKHMYTVGDSVRNHPLKYLLCLNFVFSKSRASRKDINLGAKKNNNKYIVYLFCVQYLLHSILHWRSIPVYVWNNTPCSSRITAPGSFEDDLLYECAAPVWGSEMRNCRGLIVAVDLWHSGCSGFCWVWLLLHQLFQLAFNPKEFSCFSLWVSEGGIRVTAVFSEHQLQFSES